MRPAKGGAQVSCRLQFLELDHFRAIIKDQRLPKSRWLLTQTRSRRLAQGGSRLVLLGLARQQKAALALLATEPPPGLPQRRPDPPPVPKAGSACNRLWPPGYMDTPGQAASVPAVPALPPAASVGAAQPCPSFSGPVTSSPGAGVGFGRIWSCPGAACWKWYCGGGPGQAAIVRQSCPCVQNTSMPIRSSRVRWARDMPGSCRLPGA